jgi:hypothetical protein
MNLEFKVTIDSKMAALKTKAAELVERMPELDAAIERIEQGLAEVGISAWLDRDADFALDLVEDDDGDVSGWLLGFTQISGRWRLAARHFVGGTVEPGAYYTELTAPGSTAIALADAPVGVRVQSTALFEVLIVMVQECVEAFTNILDEITSTR